MTTRAASLAQVLAAIAGIPARGARLVLAIAGPPASGKSTLAADLVAALGAGGDAAALVPMDGFHLDNGILAQMGLLPRKGAPETFDFGGFSRLVARLGTDERLYVPRFDRDRELAIAAAGVVAAECRVVVVEGNYLLLDEAPWRDLSAYWDYSILVAPGEQALRERLVRRWQDQGLDAQAIAARIEGNDLPNARRVLARRLPADLTLG